MACLKENSMWWLLNTRNALNSVRHDKITCWKLDINSLENLSCMYYANKTVKRLLNI